MKKVLLIVCLLLSHAVLANEELFLSIMAKRDYVVTAMKAFQQSFPTVLSENNITDTTTIKQNLAEYYTQEFAKEYKNLNETEIDTKALLEALNENSIALQYYYISSNTFPLGKKGNLLHAQDKSQWSDYHEKYHALFKNYAQVNQLHDVFLINLQGDIVYSVSKDIDFATNITTGSYKDSELARLYKILKIRDTATSKSLPYMPSYENTYKFIGSVIHDGGNKIGLLVVQVPSWE